jgi:hypothetical protein
LLEQGLVVLLTAARKSRASVVAMSWHIIVEFLATLYYICRQQHPRHGFTPDVLTCQSALMKAAKITDDPVLRCVDGFGCPSPHGLHKNSIGKNLKRANARARMKV